MRLLFWSGLFAMTGCFTSPFRQDRQERIDCDNVTPDQQDSGGGDTSEEPIPDRDADGYNEASDCDDTNAAINPNATEVTFDGVDNDCDGAMTDNVCIYTNTGTAEVRIWIYDLTTSEGKWVDAEPWATGIAHEPNHYRVCGELEIVADHVLRINGIYMNLDGSQGWLVNSAGESLITMVGVGDYWLGMKADEDIPDPTYESNDACVWTADGMGGGDLHCTVTYDTLMP
ncbi:MAG: putative metal-binding motif-containing protein [Candidatus Uhrbacteria bacterium]|nr:putative metal-binding motif-containing protein [Candidatus Uhrbacteria bacterium]